MTVIHRIPCAGLAVLTLIGAAATVSAQQPDRAKQRDVMRKLVEYAQNEVGRKIGDGESTALVDEALEFAGGRPMVHVTHRMPDRKKFVPLLSCGWGQRVVRLGKGNKPLIPHTGCIVQFEECRFEMDGYTYDFAHHTAIVESANGTMVTVLHQYNDGSEGSETVRRQTIDFSGLVRGSYFVYQPMPN